MTSRRPMKLHKHRFADGAAFTDEKIYVPTHNALRRVHRNLGLGVPQIAYRVIYSD
jgi:hypothetical protein